MAVHREIRCRHEGGRRSQRTLGIGVETVLVLAEVMRPTHYSRCVVVIFVHEPPGYCTREPGDAASPPVKGIDNDIILDSRIGSSRTALTPLEGTIDHPVRSSTNFIYLSNLILGSSPTKRNPRKAISEVRRPWHCEFNHTGYL